MPADFSHVRLLGFDVFGTVVDWRHGIAAEPLAFADEWRALYQPAMEPVRAGTRPWVKLDVLNRENLEQVLARHGVAAGAIPEAELAELNRAWERLPAWPDAAEGLLRLKRRFAIAPISNGHIAGMLNLARFAGLPWDAILGAEIARDYKPQPEVYLRAGGRALQWARSGLPCSELFCNSTQIHLKQIYCSPLTNSAIRPMA